MFEIETIDEWGEMEVSLVKPRIGH